MSDLRRLLFANQTRAYEGYPLVISRSVALRYLKQYQMYGNSEQDVTPTPENPVEVISVGDKTVNLFDKASIDSGYELLGDGANRSTNSSWYVSHAIPVTPNTTYYFSANPTRTSGAYVAFYSTNTISSNTYQGWLGKSQGVKNFSFTTPENCYYIRFNGKLSELDAEIQLEEGSTATSYVPYGYQIPVFAVGGGVIDLGTLNWIYQTDGTYPIFRATISAPQVATGNAPIYTKAFNVYPTVVTATYMKTEMLENTIAYQASSQTNQLIVQSSKYTTAQEFKQAMSGVKLYYQRTTDSSWTAPITTPIYLNAPLRKVGNYADVLDYKKGQIIRNVGVKVLDGTENWTDSGAFAYRKLLPITLFNPKPGVAPVCSHFVGTEGAPSSYSKCGFSSSDFIIHYANDISTADFKSWLASQYSAGTPVIVYYPLATPVTESIVAPALPTMAGSTTYTTETEVKPSNMKGVF